MTRISSASAVALAFIVLFPAITLAQPTASAPAPTFSRDVAPIFYENCTSCHRPDHIAPMSLLTYKDARPWARSIAAAVRTGTMPPWHADPAIGEFRNERRLSDAQKATILRWVEAGAPEGDPRDLSDDVYESDVPRRATAAHNGAAVISG